MQQVIKVVGATVKVVGIIVMVAALILSIADWIFSLHLERSTELIVFGVGFVLYQIGNRDWDLGKKRK